MSNAEKRLKVHADIKKNRLYFTIVGSVGKADLDRLYTEVRFCVADLKPGFDVITDLTACGLGHLSSLPTFRKITHYLASKGVRNVVRIMNPGTVILHQIINFASRAASYKSFWVTSRQEAEEFLEQSARRASLRFCLPGTEIVMQAGGKEESCPLLDISVTGCSIGTAFRPTVGSEIILKLCLPRNGEDSCHFEIVSKVVRIADNGLGIVFVGLNGDEQARLGECLNEGIRL